MPNATRSTHRSSSSIRECPALRTRCNTSHTTVLSGSATSRSLTLEERLLSVKLHLEKNRLNVQLKLLQATRLSSHSEANLRAPTVEDHLCMEASDVTSALGLKLQLASGVRSYSDVRAWENADHASSPRHSRANFASCEVVYTR